jgi:hypothetical protein
MPRGASRFPSKVCFIRGAAGTCRDFRQVASRPERRDSALGGIRHSGKPGASRELRKGCGGMLFLSDSDGFSFLDWVIRIILSR